MSDRAPITLTLYMVPSEARDALNEVVNAYGFDSFMDGNAACVTLGETMYADDVSLGAADDIVAELNIPGIAFDVYQDAKYEYDGTGYIVLPGREPWEYSGGGSGEPLVSAEAIDRALDAFDVDQNSEALAGVLAEMTGRAHRAEVKRIIDAMPDDASERRFVIDEVIA